MQSEGVSRWLAPRDCQKGYRKSWRGLIANTLNWQRKEAVTNFRLLYAHTSSDLHLNLAHLVVLQLLHVDKYEGGKTNINPWSRVVLEKLMFFSCIQEFRRILWNPKVYYHIHNSLLRVPILIQNPVYAPLSNLSKILFNIIFPSRSRFFKWSPSLRFFHQNPLRISSLPSPPLPSSRSRSEAYYSFS